MRDRVEIANMRSGREAPLDLWLASYLHGESYYIKDGVGFSGLLGELGAALDAYRTQVEETDYNLYHDDN